MSAAAAWLKERKRWLKNLVTTMLYYATVLPFALALSASCLAVVCIVRFFGGDTQIMLSVAIDTIKGLAIQVKVFRESTH